MNDRKSRLAFFRQSGWMMFASFASGLFMYAVHKAAKQMPKEEYGVFTTLLQVITLMSVPVVGLQTVFTQKAAEALHEAHERELAGILRGVLRAIFIIWLLAAALIFGLRQPILNGLKIANPAALWLTVAVGLVSMCLPILMGLLQGRQNFLWLGWASIVNGVGRFGAVCVAVLGLGCYAAGGMSAVLCGFTVALVLCAWLNRDYLRLAPLPVDWSAWWRLVVPLTFALGALNFMLSADMLFVRRFFPEQQTGYYAAAGMIGRALVFFIQALSSVIFPKLVQSAARQQKTDVLALSLGVTALVGISAALGCTLFPSLPLRVVYDKSFFSIAAPLVPWFAWCMLPMTLANVLVTALLARRRFAVVPWLAVLAGAYALTLYLRHDTFLMVIRTLGVYSSLLLLVSAWFTWWPHRSGRPIAAQAAG